MSSWPATTAYLLVCHQQSRCAGADVPSDVESPSSHSKHWEHWELSLRSAITCPPFSSLSLPSHLLIALQEEGPARGCNTGAWEGGTKVLAYWATINLLHCSTAATGREHCSHATGETPHGITIAMKPCASNINLCTAPLQPHKGTSASIQ